MFICDFLQDVHRLARADSMSGLSGDCGRVVHVESLDGARPGGVLGISESRHRNHGSAVALDEEEVEVVLVRPVRGICLEVYPVDTVVHVEVIHIY